MTEAANNTPAPKPRRWPKRTLIGVAVTAALLGGAYWYLGRETTLQALVQRIADKSGGTIVATGVTGSLYSSMHVDKLVFRSPEQLMTAENVAIDWSPPARNRNVSGTPAFSREASAPASPRSTSVAAGPIGR